MAFAKLRASEWVLVVFFAYIAAIAPFFRDRTNLKFQPVLVLLAVVAVLLLLARAEHGPMARTVAVIRDWLPLGLTLLAFREMELFLPPHFDHHYESAWIRWDHTLLHNWNLQSAI